MEVVIAIIAKIAKYTVEPIGRQLGYLIQYTSNIDSLRAEAQNLEDVHNRVQRLADAADRKGQVIGEDVQRWLTTAKANTAELNKFLRDEVNPNQRCSSFSSCPNFVSRYKVSRKANKKKLVVDDQLKIGRNFGDNNVSFDPPPPAIPEAVRINVGDVEVFKSRDLIYKGIIEALKDDKTNIIGVYGMGGIGKTTLVKDVANQLVNDYKLFDQVVMAVVSQTPNITKIQDDIASTLGLKLEQSERAHRLCEGIQKSSKRILVILDDLWDKLDLKAIGLPQVVEHKDCKILLTTRNRHVCVQMRCDQNNGIFQIGQLSEPEAWNLFKEMAGDVVDSPDLKLIAPKVAKKCAGLPLCIATVAKTLMEVKDISVWNETHRRLKNPSTTNVPEIIKEVYPSLKFSYDFVNEKEAKNCFLLCCLADEDSDIRINNLVGFGIGLGIFDDGCKLPEIKDTVRASVTKLKDRCLLLEGKYVECVRMHDVVRDFAISLLVSDVQHRSWARLDKNILSFSVLNNDKFEFSTLKMLFLKCTDESLVIPDDFFGQMKDLRVLSINNIPVLPSSVRYLVNLRTLCIEGCRVEDLSFIGELKFLEILSFDRCRIQEFPKEIEKLKSLRVLELRKCHVFGVIPTGVISSLSKLEGLYMYMSLVEWGKGGNASLIELNDLHCLRVIDMHLPDVKLFPKDLRLENLLEFKISLGTKFSTDEWNDSFLPWNDSISRWNDSAGEFKCFSRRMLKVGNVDQSISSHDGVKMLVNQAESLIIDRLEVDPENILSDLKREGFSGLKYLKVTKNHEIKCLDETVKEAIIFPVLEGLKLYDMQNLRELCRRDLPSGSFGALCELDLEELPNLQNMWVGNAGLPKLRVVKIRRCDSMKNLFSQNIVSHVKQLSLLQVEDCRNIEEILAFDEAIDEDEIELSEFKILKLTGLPNLTTFYSKRRNHISDGSVDGPPSIQKAFFSEKIAFPNLEELYISGKFEVILPEKIPGNSFCRLRILAIHSFPKIKTAIPSNLVQRFQNLEELRVTDCELLEEVVEEVPKLKHMMSKNELPQKLNNKTISCCGGLSCLSSASQEIEELTGVMKIVLPRLKIIELYQLQKLACFYNGNCTLELPLLTSLTIMYCPKLETLFISSGCEGKESQTASSSNNAANYVVQSLFNEKVLLPSLERLSIHKQDLLEKIWWYNRRLSFSQLKYVRIKECDCLRNLLTPSIVKVLSSLTDIEITRCSNLKVVVAEEEDQSWQEIIVFPQLKLLRLWYLPQLKCLYNGHCKLEFPSLATVDIRYCPKIETIWASTTSGYNKCTERRKQCYDDDSEGSTNIADTMMIPMLFNEQVLLPSLERLNIKDLKFLKEIWYNQGLPADSFSQLKYLHIQECHCLRNLLTPSIVKVLSSLSDIKIGECSNLEVVVAREEDQRRQEICIAREEEKKIIVFPQLTKLELFGLPQLKCFYYGHCKLEFPSLAIVEIIDCPKIETICASATASTNIEEMIPMLFSEQVLLPSLEKLYIDNLTLLKEIWHNQRLPADSFRQLKDLSIIKCDCVRNLLTPSIAKVLSSLIDIKIGECSSLEVVVAEEEDQSRQEICVAREEEKKIILFPQLKNLKLSGLPQLKCLYNGHCKLEFPSLATVEIRYCPKIPMLFSEQVLLPSLEKLNIDSLELLEKIWWYKQRLLAESFSQLKYLSIEECDCLRNLLTPSIVKVLSSLTDLAIRSCSSLEVVVAEEEDQSRQEIIVFPQLTELRLWGLPQLKCLYNGHCKLEFPSLATVDIRYCPKIETRCASTTASTNIAEMIPMLFSEQVLMPNLKRLDMRGKAKLLRRERIAKRMRDLQELVPSCSKDELYGLPCGSSRQRKMSTT